MLRQGIKDNRHYSGELSHGTQLYTLLFDNIRYKDVEEINIHAKIGMLMDIDVKQNLVVELKTKTNWPAFQNTIIF